MRWTLVFTVSLLAPVLLAGHATAKAPPGRYLLSSLANTVLDTATKLTWPRETSPDATNWAGAADYCAKLALDGPAPWKLPNIRQLESLVDFSEANPAIDKQTFAKIATGEYWSATKVKAAPAAFVVDFADGLVKVREVNLTGLRVLCVR